MSGEHKRKMLAVQKATDTIIKAVHSIEESEKYYVYMAAEHRDNATNLAYVNVTWHLQQEEWYLEMAKEYTDMRDVALHELALLDILRTLEVEAFQQEKALAASQKTRPLQMAKQVGKKFTWVIEDFSSLHTETCSSAPVLIGDCKWFLLIHPKVDNVSSLSMGLEVADPESLPSEWRRYVKLLLYAAKKKTGKLALLKENHLWFGQKALKWKFPTGVPLTELLDEKEGFLVNGELMIVAEIEVHEVIGKSDCSEESEEGAPQQSMKIDDGPKPCDVILNQTQESINVNGFQVLPSQVVNSVKLIFERHPDIAVGFRSKNQQLRKISMNFLLSLIDTLCQSLQEISSEDLVDVEAALTYLKYVGFEVDWLERKLEQVKLLKDEEESCLARLLKLQTLML
ncbi:hypothetical protein Bca52824_077665 [Brassica carinata]|uniref:MATH domain-containing protein n=1 Tax=Brassica carinata TaxID=52824 RepID=A0A8X7PUG3_BRACI|nr:hypothetical protein Bca52824_077665 [Brassica carinata]